MVRLSIHLVPLLALAAAARVAKRQLGSVDCTDHLGADALGNVDDAVQCINELAARGSDACNADAPQTTLCEHGSTRLSVVNAALSTGGGATGSAAATCQVVAEAAGRIMDICTRGDGTVRGRISGVRDNANVWVDIRKS